MVPWYLRKKLGAQVLGPLSMCYLKKWSTRGQLPVEIHSPLARILGLFWGYNEVIAKKSGVRSVLKQNKGSGVLGGSLIRLPIETELSYLEWTMCGDCANLGVLARGGGSRGGVVYIRRGCLKPPFIPPAALSYPRNCFFRLKIPAYGKYRLYVICTYFRLL